MEKKKETRSEPVKAMCVGMIKCWIDGEEYIVLYRV